MYRLSFLVFAVAMLIAGVLQAQPATLKGAPEYHLAESISYGHKLAQ